MMTDGEVLEFFDEALKDGTSNPDVRPIPEGESIFIMNVFKGKTRPIMAFIDGGCNCWVPEKELTSCACLLTPLILFA